MRLLMMRASLAMAEQRYKRLLTEAAEKQQHVSE